MTDDTDFHANADKATRILDKYCWNKNGTCKQCKKRNVEISNQEICRICATQNMADAAKQLHEKKGKYFNRWKRGILKSVKKL